MKFKALINNPLKVFSWWLFLELIFLLVGIPILNSGHTGDDQIPLISILYSIEIFIYGFLIICILTPIYFLEWSNRFWYISLIIGILFLLLLIWMLEVNMSLPLLNRVIENFKSVYLSRN